MYYIAELQKCCDSYLKLNYWEQNWGVLFTGLIFEESTSSNFQRFSIFFLFLKPFANPKLAKGMLNAFDFKSEYQKKTLKKTHSIKTIQNPRDFILLV